MNHKVRRAKLKDVDDILDIYNHHRTYKRHQADYRKQDFEKLIKAKTRCLILVGVVEEKVAGFILIFDMVTWGYKDVVCVRKEQRGKGLGTALYHEAERRSLTRWYSLEGVHNPNDDKLSSALERNGYKLLDGKMAWNFKYLPGHETEYAFKLLPRKH